MDVSVLTAVTCECRERSTGRERDVEHAAYDGAVPAPSTLGTTGLEEFDEFVDDAHSRRGTDVPTT